MGKVYAILFQTSGCSNSLPSILSPLPGYVSQASPLLYPWILLFSSLCGPSFFSPISAPMISSTLSRILTSLDLDPSHFGFHAFRRAAVSWAADHDVPLQNLKAHGGWSSYAIHTYLKFTPKASSTVATTFQQHFTT